MTGNAHIPEETMALYALQVLERDESAAVRAHLAGCADCRAELARAQGDLALVALSAHPQLLPAGAEERFLERIGARQKNSGERLFSMTRTKRARVWPAWLAAAAMLLVAIGLSAKVLVLRRELNETYLQLAEVTVESRHAHEVLDLLTAPQAQHVLLTTNKMPPAPTARAVYLSSRGALVMEASNLKPLPVSKTYELWVIPASGAAPIAAGLFQPDATGSASVVMPDIPWYVPAKAFGITIENAGGSTTPTAPVILAGLAPAPGD